MRVKLSGRKVITFACGNYTVRGLFMPAPSHCLLHGSGCKVVSVEEEQPREDEYDRNAKTWKTVKPG
jgi:hypothetical protein